MATSIATLPYFRSKPNSLPGRDPLALFSHRGRLFQSVWPVSHYVVVHLCGVLAYILFYILNRTTVIGKSNVPKRSNTLLLSNHQTMIDSFLIGMGAFYPASLLRPILIPWNPAAEENFYRNPILAWLSDNLKCIPIKRGRKDVEVFPKMVQGLKTSPLTFFPEGTRSRTGDIGRGRPGAGSLILETWPTVIPVYVRGMDRVLPIGSVFPRFFKDITVSYGEPLDLAEFQGKEKSKKTAQAVMDRIMEAIKALRREAHNTKPK
jgi:1-acyl-sn-glycerol-3-phosphate acyltransferase